MSPRPLFVVAVLLVSALAPPAKGEEPPAKPLTADQQDKLKEASRLESEANRLGGMGKVPEALALWQKKIVLEKQALGPAHDRVLASLRFLAGVLEREEDYPAARKARREILDALEGRLGKGHWRVTDARLDVKQVDVLAGLKPEQRADLRRARELKKRVFGLYNEGKASRALTPAREAVRLLKEILGEKHPDYADSLGNLASVYRALGDSPRALPLFQQVRDIHQEAVGEKHPDYALSLNNLAGAYWDVGEHRRALRLFEQARDTFKETLGERHPQYARALNNLAFLYQEVGEYDRALPLYLQARDLRKEVLGDKHPQYALSLGNLATLYQEVGDYGRALPLFRQALALRKEVLGEKHPDYAASLHNLGALYGEMGDYARALPLAEQARDTLKEALGEGHPDYAASLFNLASLYHEMGDNVRGLPLSEQARAIYKGAVGEKHPLYAQSLQNLASAYQATGEHARALPLYEQARAIFKEALGEKHPLYAQSLQNLASTYLEMGDYARALPLAEQAHAIRKEASGEGHPAYAVSLHNLALLYDRTGEDARALPLYRKACNLTKEALGEKHRRHARFLLDLGMFHYARGEAAAARPPLRQALAIHTRLLDDTLGALGERTRLRLLDSARDTLDAWLSLAPEAEIPTPAQYAAVLAWRGTSADPNAALRIARRQPELQNLVDQLAAARGRLATAAFRTPDPRQRDAWLKEVNALRARKEELEGRLAAKSKPFGRDLERREVSAEAVASALPEGAVLVDYLGYAHASPPLKGKHLLRGEPRLLAFVVAKGQAPRRIDLGPIRPIFGAVRRWREAVVGGRPSDLGPVGDHLRKVVWEPIEKYLGGARTVLVAPDGALCSLPLGALPGKEKGSYLVEDYAIGYLPSGRHLLAVVDPLDASEGKGLVAVGEVAYGEGLFVPLPGTAPEAAACLARFRVAFPKAEGVLLTKGTAREAKVKEQLGKSPRYVHLATHGFFESPARLAARRKGLLRDEPLAPALRDAEDRTFGLASLLKSGLALAGASEPPLGGEAEDGILTAEEVKGLDLGGCQLVTLSACQTGLGDVEAGQGVMGLQRAFHAAGARSVVASLWHVDDAATSLLIEEFYHQLWVKKRPRLEALRRAQLAILRDPEGVARRANELRSEWAKRGLKGTKALPAADPKAKKSPPALWAAFVLSGDWR